MAEATNEQTLMVTGMYGGTLHEQNGVPLRLAVPWKYGSKSIQSIVRIEFTEEQPATIWNTPVLCEYGFEAIVYPEVLYLRRSQRTEWILRTAEKYATLPYSGYGECVADLYG